MQNISNRIYEIRKDKNLSQDDVADFLEVSLRTYQRFEKEPTDLNRIKKIASFFDISYEWLLIGDEKKGSNTVIGDNNITTGGAINGNISINTSKFNHKDDVAEIIELLEYAPSGFLTIIKEKLLAFKKMSEF